MRDPIPDAATPNAKPRVWRSWPAAAMGAVTVAWMAWIVSHASHLNGGRWVYPLDDLYIHLAATRQLVMHGVWGVSYLDGFSSCLSSLLYPLLLTAGGKVFGVREWLPLAWNGLAALAAIVYTGTILWRHTRSPGLVLALLAAVVGGTPLPVVAATGMEHVWQILINLCFVDLAVRTLAAGDASRGGWAARFLPVMAGLSVMIRFEGLFVVSIVGLLLLCRGRFWLGVAVGVGAMLPLVIFGWYSVAQGGAILPNSVLLKGGSRSTGGWYFLVAVVGFAGARWPRAAGRFLLGAAVLAVLATLLPPVRHWLTQDLAARRTFLTTHLHVAILVCALAATLYWTRRRNGFWTAPVLWTGIVLVVALQHLTFADVGWVYRYEAYLMFLGFTAMAVAAADALPEGGAAEFLRRQARVWPVATVALACASAPLVVRAMWGTYKVTRASHNIYEQQYQMAHLVQRFYNDGAVAANDIGAITYYADVRMLDIFGLASADVFRARRAHDYNQATLREIVRRRDVQMIVVYDSWSFLYGGILPEWVPVGRWTIPDNVICGSDTVTFYAPDAAAAPRLTQALQQYGAELPPGVVQAGAYTAGRE